jgi:HD-like signal output (HDOD) protein
MVPPDKWAMDPLIFWRHSLGCALVSSKIAKLIGYLDPEKVYLAGLLHDLGMLVNTVTCTEDFRECIRRARDEAVPLHVSELQYLGFTHCQSGKILAEHWKFSADLTSAIEFHHSTGSAIVADALVSLVHLSDLLCRMRDLGYGYYEAMGVDLASDPAWATLVKRYPTLAKMDMVRLTLDIEASMDEIVSVVDAVFKPQPTTTVS